MLVTLDCSSGKNCMYDKAELHKVFKVCTTYCTTLPCKSAMRSAAVSWNQSGPCVWWDNLSSCRRGDIPWSAAGSFVLQEETNWARYLREKIWRASRGVEASPRVAFLRKSGFICFVGPVIDALGSKCGNYKDIIMYNKICLGGDIKSRNSYRRDKLVRNVCSVLDLT